MNSFNFTDGARTVLELARVDAHGRHHASVDPEHILLGLVVDTDGAGAAVLRHLGLDLQEVRTRVERRLKPSWLGRRTGPHMPYTRRAKRVLQLAVDESRDFNHSHVGSEHLVMAVMRENGVAAQALTEAGASLSSLRTETRRLLRTLAKPDATPGPEIPIARLTIDLERADGSGLRRDFQSVGAAVDFLERIGPDRG